MSFIHDTFTDAYLEHLDKPRIVQSHGFEFKDKFYVVDYLWIYRPEERRHRPVVIGIHVVKNDNDTYELIPYPDDVAEAAIAEIEVETGELCLV